MGTPSTPPSKKRKRVATPASERSKKPFIDLTQDDSDDATPKTPMSKKRSTSKSQSPEKRLRRYRAYPPGSFLEKLGRATTQRMFVIGRTRGGTEEIPEETVEMAGTTGNVYSVNIGLVPNCTCPDHMKGNQCKHIIYVLYNVLKAPEHLQYQLAFLSSELREIMAGAPLDVASNSSTDAGSNNRKEITGDCPICFTEFEPSTEDIVYCKAACGNNIHRECFEQWAKSRMGAEVRCVYCRTPWQGDEESIKKICKSKGRINGEGYTNIAAELGLSGARDYSTYHQPWVRGQGLGYY